MPSPMLLLTAGLPLQKKLHRKAVRRLARLEANTRREALGQVGAKLLECTDASTSQGQCLEFWRETIESTQQVLATQRQEAREIVRSFRARAEAMESRRMEKEDARSRDAESYFETAASKLSASISGALHVRDDEQRTKTKDMKPKRKKLRKSTTRKKGTKKINLSKRPAVSSESVAHVANTTTEIEQFLSNQDLTQHQHDDSQHRDCLERVQGDFVEKDEENKEMITEVGDTECERSESVLHETKELFMMRDEESTGETIRIWRQREVECALALAREDVESQYADEFFRREVAIAINESEHMSNEDAWSASQYREAWRRIDEQQREASERASMLQAESARRHEEMAEKLVEWEQLCLGKRQRALVRVTERLDAHLRQSYDVDLYAVEDIMIASKDTTRHRSTWTDLRVEFRLGFETLRGPSAVFKSQSGNVPPVLEILVSHAQHGVLGVSFYDMTRLKRRHAGTEKLWLPLRPRRDEATGLPIGAAAAGEQWLEREKKLAPASKAYANRLRLQHSVAQTRTTYRVRLGGIENDQAVPPASFAGNTIHFQRTGPNEYTSEFLGPKRLCYYHDLRLGNIVIFGDEVWRLASYVLPGGLRGDFSGCESKAPVDPMERLHAEKVQGFLKMRAVILMQRQVRRFRARNERRFRDALRYGTAMEGWILHADVELQQCFFAHELLPGQVTWAPEEGEEFEAHLRRVEKARKARLEAALCSVIEVLPRVKQYEQIAKVLDEGVASCCGQDAKHRPDHARMLAILEGAPLDDFAAQLSIACINWEFYEESSLAGKSYLQRALRAVKAVLLIGRPWSDWTPRQFSTATKILLASGNRRAARAQLRSFVAFANDLGCDHPDFARQDKLPECAAEIEDTMLDLRLKKSKSQRQGKTTSRSTMVQPASMNAPTMSKTKAQRKKGDKARRGKKRTRGEFKEPKQDHSIAKSDETSGEQDGPLAALPWPIVENLAGLELCADHAARARHVLYQLLEQNIVQREPHCAREAEYLFAVAMCFTDPDAEMARESRDAAFRAAVKADPSVKTQWLTSSVWWEDSKPWALAGVRFASRGALGFAVTALEIAMDRGGVLEFTELDALGRAAFAFGRPRLAQLAADEALATSRFEGEEEHAVRAIQLHAKYSQVGSQWRRCAILCCGVAHGKQRARQRYLRLLHEGAVASNRERQAAAKMLQKIVRARRDRKIVARLRRQQHGVVALRARVLARIRQLRLSTAFSTWHLTSTQRRGVREMCTRRLRGLVFSCWRSWMFHHEEMRALKIASAMRIQRQRRAFLLRRLIDRRVQQTRAERARLAFLERCFLERQAASTIQRCVRGYFAKLRRQRRPEVLLQARIRGRIWRERYRRTKQAAITVQAWWRGCRTRLRARPQFQEHFMELAMAFAAGETATNGRGSVAAVAGGTMSGDKASILKGRERSRLRLGAAKQLPRSRQRSRRKGDPASHNEDNDNKIREESVRLPPIGSLMAPSAQLKAAYVLRCKTRRKT